MDNDQFYHIFKSHLETEISSSLEATDKNDALKDIKAHPGMDIVIKDSLKVAVEYVKNQVEVEFKPVFDSLSDAEKEHWQNTIKMSLSPVGIGAMQKVKPLIRSLSYGAQEAFMRKLMGEMDGLDPSGGF